MSRNGRNNKFYYSTADDAYGNFIVKLAEIYRSNFPCKKMHQAIKTGKPWVRGLLSKTIKIKKNLFHKLIEDQDTEILKV